MRSALSAGAGSDDIRRAINNAIPNPRTPSKAYAEKQLDAIESLIRRLQRGVPKVKLANVQGGGSPSKGPLEGKEKLTPDNWKTWVGPKGERVIKSVVGPSGKRVYQYADGSVNYGE